MMNENVYAAFRSLGVDDDKARAAAVSIYEDIADLAEIKSTQRLQSWMLGFVIALLAGQYAVLFSLASHLH